MKHRLASLVVLFLLAIHPSSDSAQSPPAAAATDMAAAALKFWNALTPEQQAKASFAFTDDERKNWFFIPTARKGLPWKEMSAAQRELAHAFLKSGLSPRGYDKATSIMAMETTLGALEGAAGSRRDPELYFFTIFGKPGTAEPWGWRVEGHHVSFNFTIAGNMVVVAPHFLGVNPAKVPSGPKQGQRVLAAEEDMGRALIKALSEEQRKVAIFSATAPGEIVTSNSRKIDPLKPTGITAAQLNADQKKMLMDLIGEYAGCLRSELAQQDLNKIEQAGTDKIYFGWAGSTEVGGPHYYRIQGPTFMVEYDDTQNGANHIHTVWRDAANDFGEDILREHYAKQPHN